MYGLHNHTIYSHDGYCSVFEMCESAIKKGMKGLAFTDHVDLILFEERKIYDNTVALINDVKKAKELYKGKLDVLLGMEIGEEIHFEELGKQVRALAEYDVILASIHFLTFLGVEYDICYTDVPLWSREKIQRVLTTYYQEILKTAKQTDFDVLAHLTYPLRYVNAVYKKGYDERNLYDVFEEIFKVIIKRDIALELNTSNAVQSNYFLPNKEIIKLYKSMGGKLITIGTDAHIKENVDNGFLLGKELFKECGYTEYYYYKDRKPFSVKL